MSSDATTTCRRLAFIDDIASSCQAATQILFFAWRGISFEDAQRFKQIANWFVQGCDWSLHDMSLMQVLLLQVRIASAFFRNPMFAKFAIGSINMLLRKMLHALVERDLTEEETAFYTEPFKTVKSRKALWV